MEDKYQYKEMHTNEVVEDFMAEDYVFKKLGLKQEAQGNNGELTQDQIEFKEAVVDWFFSGNWIKERVIDE